MKIHVISKSKTGNEILISSHETQEEADKVAREYREELYDQFERTGRFSVTIGYMHGPITFYDGPEVITKIELN